MAELADRAAGTGPSGNSGMQMGGRGQEQEDSQGSGSARRSLLKLARPSGPDVTNICWLHSIPGDGRDLLRSQDEPSTQLSIHLDMTGFSPFSGWRTPWISYDNIPLRALLQGSGERGM